MPSDGGPRYRQHLDANSKSPQEAKFFNLPEVYAAATLQRAATFWSIIREDEYGAADFFPKEGDPIYIQTLKGLRGIDESKWSQPVQLEGAELDDQWQLRDRMDLMDQVVLL